MATDPSELMLTPDMSSSCSPGRPLASAELARDCSTFSYSCFCITANDTWRDRAKRSQILRHNHYQRYIATERGDVRESLSIIHKTVDRVRQGDKGLFGRRLHRGTLDTGHTGSCPTKVARICRANITGRRSDTDLSHPFKVRCIRSGVCDTISREAQVTVMSVPITPAHVRTAGQTGSNIR